MQEAEEGKISPASERDELPVKSNAQHKHGSSGKSSKRKGKTTAAKTKHKNKKRKRVDQVLPPLPEGVNEDDTRPLKKAARRPTSVAPSEGDRPTVIVRNGFRYVIPYDFEFRAYAKQRWFGRTVGDVFMTEFEAHAPEYFKQAILDGRITVRGRKVPLDYILDNGDWVCHRSHRHEPPILDLPIEVIDETDDLLVINKPPSMPVHVTGSYRVNSLLQILAETYDYQLFTVNRLDRLTSGLMILAKSSKVAAALSKKFRERQLSKTYLARVKGEFPTGEVVVDQPLMVADHKTGRHKIDPKGKPSKTKFTRLSYNGRTSVVRCKPVTGRTHQIRLHLQHLGHPIANDPVYGGELIETRNPDDNMEDEKNDGQADILEDALRNSAVSWCPHCSEFTSKSASRPSKDYAYGIWLHALRYESVASARKASQAVPSADAASQAASSGNKASPTVPSTQLPSQAVSSADAASPAVSPADKTLPAVSSADLASQAVSSSHVSSQEVSSSLPGDKDSLSIVAPATLIPADATSPTGSTLAAQEGAGQKLNCDGPEAAKFDPHEALCFESAPPDWAAVDFAGDIAVSPM